MKIWHLSVTETTTKTKTKKKTTTSITQSEAIERDIGRSATSKWVWCEEGRRSKSIQTMALTRGLMVIMILVFFIVCAPGCVFGSRTRLLSSSHEDDSRVDRSKPSETSPSSGLGSITGLDSVGTSYRNLLEKKTREPEEARPTKREGQAPSMSVPSPAPRTQFTLHTHFASRFSGFFRSLAKGSTSPTPGTPSPGHN